jgi:hypothetical protein
VVARLPQLLLLLAWRAWRPCLDLTALAAAAQQQVQGQALQWMNTKQ